MNPNPKRFNKERWDYGKSSFDVLRPILEYYLDEPLEETKLFYDIMDAKTKHWDIEVKSRTPKYHWEDSFIMREGWLIPSCKVEYAKKSDRPFLFFYWWRADNSLWELEYSDEAIEGLTPIVPPWHKEQQEHYYIPFNRWTRIEITEE